MSFLHVFAMMMLISCISPSPKVANTTPQKATLGFNPTIQKEWQQIFFDQFKKDPTATMAIGFFSSGGWNNEGQAMFIDRGGADLRFVYAHPNLAAEAIDRLVVSQIAKSELKLSEITSAFPLERVDMNSFDNLTWEVVIFERRSESSNEQILSQSVYINCPGLEAYPKHAQLISSLRTAVAKAQKDKP